MHVVAVMETQLREAFLSEGIDLRGSKHDDVVMEGRLLHPVRRPLSALPHSVSLQSVESIVQ